jgi:hypothetical protein
MKIDLPCANIEVLSPNLVHIVYRDEYEVELKDVKAVDQAFLDIAQESAIYVVMDTKRRYNIFSTEAQKFLSKETSVVQKSLLGGFAMIIDSLPYRIMVKFYMRFYKPNYKLQVFSNEIEAVKWLNKLREQAASVRV